MMGQREEVENGEEKDGKRGGGGEFKGGWQ